LYHDALCFLLYLGRWFEPSPPVMYSDSDEIIIRGIRNRDDNAFHYLQVKFRDSIRLMVLEAGGTGEDASDVFSDGIVALIRLVDREDFQLSCKLGTLLYALCNKAWKQQLEKKVPAGKYWYRKEDDGAVDDFTEAQDEALYRKIFWDSFQKLGQTCREILQAYLMEIPPKEIAEILGRSYGFIRKKKNLCHGYLVRMIEGHPDFRKIKQEERTLTTG